MGPLLLKRGTRDRPHVTGQVGGGLARRSGVCCSSTASMCGSRSVVLVERYGWRAPSIEAITSWVRFCHSQEQDRPASVGRSASLSGAVLLPVSLDPFFQTWCEFFELLVVESCDM